MEDTVTTKHFEEEIYSKLDLESVCNNCKYITKSWDNKPCKACLVSIQVWTPTEFVPEERKEV